MNRLLRVASDAASSRLFRTAEVTAVDSYGEAIRSVRLAGSALRGVRWVPGQKVQIRLEGFTTRTYTPIRWDPDIGETEIIAYLHGAGPGSTFVRDAEPGHEWQLFGPRSSLDLTKVTGTPLLVGDETSFGLAAAWGSAVDRPARMCLEVQDIDVAMRVLETLGLADAELVAAPSPDDFGNGVDVGAGLAGAVADRLREDPGLHLVLTGRAQSIRRVRAHLKEVALRPQVMVKAYWDENRAGLD